MKEMEMEMEMERDGSHETSARAVHPERNPLERRYHRRRFGWKWLAGAATLLIAGGAATQVAAQSLKFRHVGTRVEIVGTEKADEINLLTVGNNFVFHYRENGGGAYKQWTRPIASVRKVRFSGRGGNDRFAYANGGVSPNNGYYPFLPQVELFGGSGDDRLYGGPHSDLIVGGSGNDVINGYQGADILLGQDGNDVLYGGTENDFQCGGRGNDALYGNAGNDWLFSGPEQGFRETLSGAPGNDFLAREACSALPTDLAGDWNGDGHVDRGYYLPERSLFLLPGGPVPVVAFGLPGDKPIVGDWLGNGYSRPGVFRNGLFLLDVGNYGYGPHGFQESVGIPFGLPGDIPVAGDWAAENYDRVGVYRNGIFYLDHGPAGWHADSWQEWPGVAFGGFVGDRPVIGDWNGDRKSDVGVYRFGTWFLDEGRQGWGAETPAEIYGIPFGGAFDLPLAADWDADGFTELGYVANDVLYFSN